MSIASQSDHHAGKNRHFSQSDWRLSKETHIHQPEINNENNCMRNFWWPNFLAVFFGAQRIKAYFPSENSGININRILPWDFGVAALNLESCFRRKLNRIWFYAFSVMQIWINSTSDGSFRPSHTSTTASSIYRMKFSLNGIHEAKKKNKTNTSTIQAHS